MLNLGLIAKECGINEGLEVKKVLQNLMLLEHKYSDEDLIQIYNYILTTVMDKEVLKYILNLTDMFRDKSTLSILVNLLLFQAQFEDTKINRDEFIEIRVMCVKAMAKYKEPSVIAPLMYCLKAKNENYKVRLACADCLGKMGDKYAVAPLIDLVKDEEEKSVYVRESAAFALGMLGDKRAVEPLINILETKKGFIDKFTFLKERVLEALGKLNVNSDKESDRIFKILKNSLSDESAQIRINAIEGLMNSETSEGEDLIRKVLVTDRDDEVKKNALIALYNMTGRDILDEVLKKEEYDETLKSQARELIDEYETE